MARLHAIVIDCRSAPTLARFWAEALDGYAVRDYDDEEVARLATLGLTPATDPTVAVDGPGPTLWLQQVPERKAVKNRVHVDLAAPDRGAEVGRLVDLGAQVLAVHDGLTVLADPEGNEFCVVDAPDDGGGPVDAA